MNGTALDRLSARLAILTALLVVPPLCIGLHSLAANHYERTLDLTRRAAEHQNLIIETTLRHEMEENDIEQVDKVLREIGSQPQVRRVMILDHDGVVRFASSSELTGQRFSRDSPSCMVCHAVTPEERGRWIIIEEEDSQSIRAVHPIENRPECHACHGDENRLNGMLILDVSMAEVDAQLQRDTLWMIAGTVLLAVLILAAVVLMVRQLVLVRLARLRRSTRALAEGELETRASVDGLDMIGALAGDFNEMADALSNLIGEVRGHEAQLMTIIDGLDDGLVVLDRDLSIVAANRSFCRRLGTYPDSVQGKICRQVTGGRLPCCAGEGECPTHLCLETGEVQRSVLRLSGEGGEPLLVEEVHASPVYDEEGNVCQIVEIWRDISERVKEEERLAEIERLASLGVLASGFSHEVNTPLASMLTCAEASISRIDEDLERDPASSLLPALRDYANTIREQVLRCKRITAQFLRFSRGIPPSIEPIDLAATVAGVIQLANPTASEAQVEIRAEEPGELPAVKANTEVVKHVLLNLLVNAIQSFDGEGGSVVVGYDVRENVHVLIEDSGSGVKQEDRQHLFEPFQSRKPHGTGLGLFLSRTFMRRFDGDVRLVRSTVGKGSCFEVIFARAGEGTP